MGAFMEVLAHRGWWDSPAERNSRHAFERAFAAGYGVETDVRDRNGVLVIAHDPPTDSSMTVDAFLDLYKQFPDRPTLALNIKSDGLADLLSAILAEKGVPSYFVFDMSIPDTLGCLRAGLTTFLRRSEHESCDSLMPKAAGIWLDDFGGDYITSDVIRDSHTAAKRVAIVSPELHGHPHEASWRAWRDVICELEGIILCTDFPADADAFFNREPAA